MGARRFDRRRIERRLRGALAEARFFLFGFRVVVRPALALLVAAVAGTLVLRHVGAAPSWRRSAYAAYGMLMGSLGELPRQPAAQLVAVVLPVVGLLFVAEGVVKLGISAFRKADNPLVWIPMLASTSRKHIILCGLGTVGYRVLEELLALDEQVFVIERNPTAEFVSLARSKGAEVLIGDARAEDQLRLMNLDKARAIIIATNDDLANLEIAMDVREMHAHIPIVLRLFDQRLADKVGHVIGIELSVSTSKLAAPLFACAALDKRVVGTHRLGEILLVVLQLDPGPGSPLVGCSVGDVVTRHAITVVALETAAGWDAHPAPTRTIMPGRKLQILLPGGRVHETVTWG